MLKNRNSLHYNYVCAILFVDNEDGEITVQAYTMRNQFASEFVLQEK